MKTRLSLIVCMVLMIVAAGGCMTTPGTAQAKAGYKAYKKGDIPVALDSFNEARDANDAIFAQKKFRKHRDAYLDTQIVYGSGQAQEAEQNEELFDAWVWYTQVAGVDGGRAECQAAAKGIERIEGSLAPRCLEKAEQARSSGQNAEALKWAIRSAAYGERAAANALIEELCDPFVPGLAEAVPHVSVTRDAFEGPVRTDSLERLAHRPQLDVDGVEVYYGEPNRYYVPIKDVKVAGTPEMAVHYLAPAAKKKGGDGLINVHLSYQGQNPVTEAQIVKFADFSEQP